MNKEKEEMLEKLRNVKQTSESYLKENNFENYVVKNVIHYNKKVQLVNKETNKKEEFDLYAVIAENINPEKDGEEIFELEYLENKEGKLFTISDLIKEYEGFENIKDVVDKTKENEEKPEEEQDKEFKKDNLEELEAEKEQEEKGETKNVDKKKDEKENSKNDLTGKKPTHVLQTIDVNSTYIDNWTTVSKGFDLPPEVKQIAIAYPIQKDDHIISSTMTMYMLDARGNIIENVNGKTIRDYFKLDDSTGHNPMYDDNTKYELEGYAEKNKGQTMRRFKSKESPSLYLSIEQKEVGGYHEVYAGGRTLDGNDPVEIQLETRNEEIQTSLELQEEFGITYKGKYEKDDKDKEADLAEKDECKPQKISLENADGDKSTVALRCKHIPGTDMTWEELSEETKEGIEKLQERFGRELRNGKEPEVIVKNIERDYEMINRSQEHKHY